MGHSFIGQHQFHAGLLCLVCWAGSMPASAQSCAGAPVPTIRVSAQLVLLDVSVEVKQTGQQIGGLTLADFDLKEDGQAQSLSYISQHELPLSVVFLFDITDSVRPVLRPLAEGARTMLDHLRPEDEAAVMVFSSHARLLLGFTPDHNRLADAISHAADMADREAMFLNESMYEAVEQSMLATAPSGRRVTVWLTDGLSNNENAMTRRLYGKHAPEKLHTRQEAEQVLASSGVAVSALIEHSAMTNAMLVPSMLGSGHVGEINRYAEFTGGAVLNTGKQEVAARLSTLLDELRERYTLGFRSAAAKPPGTRCRLSLALTPAFFAAHPGLKSKDLVVRTRQAYVR